MRRSLALAAVAAALVPSPRCPQHRTAPTTGKPAPHARDRGTDRPEDKGEKDLDGWNTLITALEAYKQEHGDLRVPTRYTVPEDLDSYPVECRGLKLGQRVASIRATGRYVDDETRRRVLDDMGFEWRLRRPSASQQAKQPVEPFDVLVTALEVYQRENGESTVPSTFVVPNADPWPPSCRGLPLGARVEALRDPDHPYFEGPELAEREAS